MTPAANNDARQGYGIAHLSERPRILVVEDEALLALEIAKVLSEAGFTVIGPARSVDQALELAGRAGCQAAVLDVRLRNETAEHIAHELKSLGMPFITLSGYSQSRLPPVFSEAPFIGKPLQPELLIAELNRCINHG
ncbi:MAG: response regulator [Rhodomicrobium sp.]